ncbi:unnamed protein product [Blepharisma stoltei]|uniref:UBC core domain-containing protein n=1 Tax=Blepharisma stoltei TaxID=1481888 RepID=A0AAU9IUY2_9CILI|nr:unnamed protein product [Blepharisma stoltei]
MATKRINLELQRLKNKNLTHIVYQPYENNIFNCWGMIEGPENTPYQGGIFYVLIKLPLDYPFKNPKIYFMTKIFHPAVSESGKICCNTVFDEWSPKNTIEYLLQLIWEHLKNPVCCCGVGANLFKNDKNRFIQTAQQWTQYYAN